VYCDIWKIKPNKEDEISLQQTHTLFTQLNKDLVWLALSGGEITLVDYFYELVDDAVLSCPNLKLITFTTNALSHDRALDYALYVKNKGLDIVVTISLDGDDNLHDYLRGINGNYNKCLDLHESLKKSGISTHFGLTVSDANAEFVNNQFEKYENKIRSITFVHSEGIYNKKTTVDHSKILSAMKHIYDNYTVYNLSEIIEKIHIKISLQYLRNKMSYNVIPCDVLNSSLHIMPSGDIHPCMYLPRLGNINNDDVRDVLSGKECDGMKRSILNGDCPHCWMNCYSPFSIMQHPVKSLLKLF